MTMQFNMEIQKYGNIFVRGQNTFQKRHHYHKKYKYLQGC